MNLESSKPKLIQVDIVSPEGSLFSGKVSGLYLKSTEGELGILPGHLQLLTKIAPCSLRMTGVQASQDQAQPQDQPQDDEEVLLFVSGGVLEVQPNSATLLADTALRPQDVNEAAAQEARESARKILDDAKSSNPKDIQQAQMDLLDAMARIQVLELMRRKNRH